MTLSDLAPAIDCIHQGIGNTRPEVAIILGSGLGGLAKRIESACSLPFDRIPGMVRSTAAGHRGEFISGSLSGKSVVAMAGRLHLYEGWSVDQVVYPVRLLQALGASILIVSNAAGGLRPTQAVADPLIIRDHINWLGSPASRARLSLARGQSPYDARLAELALSAGRDGDFAVHQGTYLATLGPTYETRAEYRMMRRIGADCVGMSTVPEVLMAQQLGMRVLAISMISNVAKPDRPSQTTHEEVLDAGRLAGPRMFQIVDRVIRQSD